MITTYGYIRNIFRREAIGNKELIGNWIGIKHIKDRKYDEHLRCLIPDKPYVMGYTVNRAELYV